MSLKSAVAAKKSRTNVQKEAAIQEVTQEPMKRLNVNVPESTLNAFKAKAASDGLKMSSLLNQWINEYLSK